MSHPSQVSDYQLVVGLFLRLLALIYLAAFVSIGVQIVRLAGSEGILPYAESLRHIEQHFGSERYWFHPSLFWINAGDTMLQAVAITGCVFSILLFFNRIPRVALTALFLLYLSLFHAGQIFMNFQWDYLLLECGFLAIFLSSGSRFIIGLYRWLLFRVRFLSGASKLISQDPTWANLTALSYYFETQPLPHWGSWYAHQLPEWLLKVCTGSTLLIELLVPFMMFLSRGPRFFAAWVTILMQVLIILTSNHNFFNLLVIVLCLFLFDDRALRHVIPASMERWLVTGVATAPAGIARAIGGALAGLIMFVSVFQIWEMFSGRRSSGHIAALIEHVQPFHIVNKYHVFPTMRTERYELVVEGSRDGQNWHAYEFRYKPGKLGRRPEIILPHQPRLDWMMWFVPFQPVLLPMLERLQFSLLENSPAVMDLLARNPFPGTPPRYLRTTMYHYRFTDRNTLKSTGQWWQRDYMGPFVPLPYLQGR